MATAEMKQQLETMIKAIIAEDTSAADEAFSAFIRMKSQDILGEDEDGNPFAKKDDKDEDKDDEDKEDKDEDKDDE